MPKFSLRTLLLLFFGFGIALAFVCQVIFPIREAARRNSCSNQIRQITLALLNYESANEHLPIGIETSPDGSPYRSWRRLTFVYLEQLPPVFYDLYDENSAWDSKSNTQFYDGTLVVQTDKFGGNRRVDSLDPCPETWCCPSDSTKRINYAVVVGTETAFPPNQNVKLDEITDGLENTILVVETLSGSDKWTEPRDLQFDSMSFVISKSKNGEIGSRHPGGASVGFADGEVHFITDAISPEELRALLTIAGNEPITRQQLIDRGVIR